MTDMGGCVGVMLAGDIGGYVGVILAGDKGGCAGEVLAGSLEEGCADRDELADGEGGSEYVGNL